MCNSENKLKNAQWFVMRCHVPLFCIFKYSAVERQHHHMPPVQLSRCGLNELFIDLIIVLDKWQYVETTQSVLYIFAVKLLSRPLLRVLSHVQFTFTVNRRKRNILKAFLQLFNHLVIVECLEIYWSRGKLPSPRTHRVICKYVPFIIYWPYLFLSVSLHFAYSRSLLSLFFFLFKLNHFINQFAWMFLYN